MKLYQKAMPAMPSTIMYKSLSKLVDYKYILVHYMYKKLYNVLCTSFSGVNCINQLTLIHCSIYD